MRIYLAGPMSGYADLNHPAFDRAATQLRAQGHEVVSPAEMDRALGIYSEGDYKISLQEIMRNDLLQVLQCDAMALLWGWQRSRGARLERVVAESCGIPVYQIVGGDLLPADPWEHELIFGRPLPEVKS